MAARGIVALLTVMAAVAPAGADNGFVWHAPAPCPGAAEVRARIEQRLGMSVDGSVHGIAVAIAQEGDGFVARIDARGVTLANQVRTLSSARCDDLADAVAVVVARLATEARIQQEIERRDAPIPVPPAEAPRGPGRWGGGARALAVSGIGALPGINVGGEVALYGRRGSHFVEVVGARWARSTAYLLEGAPGGVDVRLTTLGLRAGWSSPQTYVRAWLGAEIGRMSGEGVALIQPQLGSGRWTAADGGVAVAWPMARHVRLVGTFEVFVPLERVRFALTSGTGLYEPAAAGARCALGLELGWR